MNISTVERAYYNWRASGVAFPQPGSREDWDTDADVGTRRATRRAHNPRRFPALFGLRPIVRGAPPGVLDALPR